MTELTTVVVTFTPSGVKASGSIRSFYRGNHNRGKFHTQCVNASDLFTTLTQYHKTNHNTSVENFTPRI